MTRRLVESGEFHRARRVASYCSLSDEMPTEGLLRAVLESGRTLLLPRRGSSQQLEFVAADDLGSLVRGSFGVLEPPPSVPAEPLRVDDLVLTPGVAFDRAGIRLGRGGGWYDRSVAPGLGLLLGVAFAFQIVAEVPATSADRRMEGFVTEQEVWRVRGVRERWEPPGDPG